MEPLFMYPSAHARQSLGLNWHPLQLFEQAKQIPLKLS